MTENAQKLREHLRRVGEVKARVDVEPGSPGERIEQTIRHSEAHLAAFGPGPDDESEVEAWRRANEHLRALRHG